jgi:hypothetical protein
MYELFQIQFLNIVGYNGACMQGDFESHVFMATCGSGNTTEQDWQITS